MMIIIVGRFTSVFVIYYGSRICSRSKNTRVNFAQLLYISYAALIRGAIAFGLVARL